LYVRRETEKNGQTVLSSITVSAPQHNGFCRRRKGAEGREDTHRRISLEQVHQNQTSKRGQGRREGSRKEREMAKRGK